MSPAPEGNYTIATPRAFRTYCLFIPRLLMTWQPRIQNICSHGVNLVPLEFRSRHHKVIRLKLKSGLTPKTFNVLGFFADKVLYMGVFLTSAWWRHQMETFSALLAICAGNSPVPGEFPTRRPATRDFDAFFDLHPNKRLSIQWWGWWFETQSCPLWRHSIGQFMCLQSATCKAYNCNVTEGTFTQFSSPCSQAFGDPVVFRKTPVNRCYGWVPNSPGDPLDERMIATDYPWCIMARLQVDCRPITMM